MGDRWGIDGVGVIDLQRTQREHTYTYDPAGRLTAHDVDSARTDWTFDANGNRTHENGTEIARYDAEDRLIPYEKGVSTQWHYLKKNSFCNNKIEVG